MYHHLRGRLVARGPMTAIVEVGGVGYELRVPLSTLERLAEGDEVCLYTRLVIRDESLRLYGFGSEDERALFDRLVGVSGVGPAIALGALSSLSPPELVGALESGDTKTLCRVRGVGKRLAERLVVELKDRVGRELASISAGAPRGEPSGAANQALVRDAIDALVLLGCTQKEAEERVSSARDRLSSSDGKADPTVEALIREALR